MINIIAGSDELIEFTLKDNLSTLIQISDLEDLIIKVSDIDNIYKYTLGNGINIVDNHGIVNIVIDREFTLNNQGRIFDLLIELVFDMDGINEYYLDNKKHNVTELERYIKIESISI